MTPKKKPKEHRKGLHALVGEDDSVLLVHMTAEAAADAAKANGRHAIALVTSEA